MQLDSPFTSSPSQPSCSVVFIDTMQLLCCFIPALLDILRGNSIYCLWLVEMSLHWQWRRSNFFAGVSINCVCAKCLVVVLSMVLSGSHLEEFVHTQQLFMHGTISLFLDPMLTSQLLFSLPDCLTCGSGIAVCGIGDWEHQEPRSWRRWSFREWVCWKFRWDVSINSDIQSDGMISYVFEHIFSSMHSRSELILSL